MDNQLQRVNNSVTVHTYWQETLQLLKSLGFRLYDAEEDSTVYVEYCDTDIVLIEKEFSRNVMVIVLHEEYGFDIYIQEDVACGVVEMPVRWSEIEFDWLNDLRKAFNGEGFKKK